MIQSDIERLNCECFLIIVGMFRAIGLERRDSHSPVGERIQFDLVVPGEVLQKRAAVSLENRLAEVRARVRRGRRGVASSRLEKVLQDLFLLGFDVMIRNLDAGRGIDHKEGV